MAVLAAAPASASAETLCVNDPSCTGTDKVNLQAALNHAGMTAADDRVEIGAGTYSDGPFVYPQGFLGTVEVVGAGQGDTTLTAGALASNQFVLSLEHAGSVLEDLTIAVTAGDSGARGLYIGAGTARRITVSSSPSVEAVTGIELSGSELHQSKVLLPLGDPSFRAIFAVDDTTVSRSTLRGQTGIGHDSGTLTLSRTRITAGQAGLDLAGGVVADNTLIDMGSCQFCDGVLLRRSDGSADLRLDARHLTLVGGSTGSRGIRADAVSPSGEVTVAVALRDSIIRGFDTAISRFANNDDASNVTTRFVNYDSATNFSDNDPTGSGSIVNRHRTNRNPRFVKAPAGNFHLKRNSRLIDAGKRGLGGPPKDLDGRKRVVDGDGDGRKRRDLGAYERRKP